MVTSTSSGLAVPDWPTTYGQNMFTFPFSKMVGGIFYEHGHRLIASTVGFLTIGLVVWSVARRAARLGAPPRPGRSRRRGPAGRARRHHRALLLPDAVSISHAGLAQIFFCLTVSLALFTSPSWRRRAPAPVDDARLRRGALLTDGARLSPDSPRRDDAAHRRRTGDSGFPAVLRSRGAARVVACRSRSTSPTGSAHSW